MFAGCWVADDSTGDQVEALATVVKAILPGSLAFFGVVATVAVALWYCGPRPARWGRRVLTVVVLAYWFMSTTAGVDTIEWPLRRGYRPLTSTADAQRAQAIVMLSGGTFTVQGQGGFTEIMTTSTALRALETARLSRMFPQAIVVVSGGRADESQREPEAEVARRELARLGVAADRILTETTSRNTHEHPIHLKPFLRDRHIDQFILVTTATHLPRARRSFAAQGLHPIASAAPTRSEEGASIGLKRWQPREGLLSVAEHAFREYLGFLYYAARRRFGTS